MKIKVISSFVIFFFFLSCDNPKKDDFSINIDLVIKQNDSIQLFYSDYKTLSFTEKKSFWTKVTGNKKNQTIKITFPDSVRPKQIRIDFGRNRLQPEIILNKIEFSFKENAAIYKGKEIFYIFREDQNNTVADKLNGSIKRKNANQINGPSLYPKGEKLYNRLNQLYSQK